MRLRAEFLRFPGPETVLADVLPSDIAEGIAQWQRPIEETEYPLLARRVGGEQADIWLQRRRARLGREGLWIRSWSRAYGTVQPFPRLDEVASMEGADRESWRQFVERYGLPAREEEWKAGTVNDTPTPGPLVSEIFRIPLTWLNEFAILAGHLVAAEEAALGRPEALRVRLHLLNWPYERWDDDDPELRIGFVNTGEPEDRSDEGLVRFGRDRIRRELSEALESMEAVWKDDSFAIPDAWVFATEGWWPLTVLDEFVHRGRYVRLAHCGAEGCTKVVPEGRRLFCSERCRQREKKRRQRGFGHAGRLRFSAYSTSS